MAITWDPGTGTLEVGVTATHWHAASQSLTVTVGRTEASSYGRFLDILAEVPPNQPVLGNVLNDPAVDNRVHLSWASVDGAASYQPQVRRRGSSDAWTNMINVAPYRTVATQAGYTGAAGTEYEFRCRSYTAAVTPGPWSDLAFGATELAPPGSPGVIVAGHTQVTWSAAARATGYRWRMVFRSEGQTIERTGTVAGALLNIDRTGIHADAPYVVTITPIRTNASDGPTGVARWGLAAGGTFIGSVVDTGRDASFEAAPGVAEAPSIADAVNSALAGDLSGIESLSADDAQAAAGALNGLANFAETVLTGLTEGTAAAARAGAERARAAANAAAAIADEKTGEEEGEGGDDGGGGGGNPTCGGGGSPSCSGGGPPCEGSGPGGT